MYDFSKMDLNNTISVGLDPIKMRKPSINLDLEFDQKDPLNQINGNHNQSTTEIGTKRKDRLPGSQLKSSKHSTINAATAMKKSKNNDPTSNLLDQRSASISLNPRIN
jgi:hypothetical protein